MVRGNGAYIIGVYKGAWNIFRHLPTAGGSTPHRQASSLPSLATGVSFFSSWAHSLQKARLRCASAISRQPHDQPLRSLARSKEHSTDDSSAAVPQPVRTSSTASLVVLSADASSRPSFRKGASAPRHQAVQPCPRAVTAIQQHGCHPATGAAPLPGLPRGVGRRFPFLEEESAATIAGPGRHHAGFSARVDRRGQRAGQ